MQLGIGAEAGEGIPALLRKWVSWVPQMLGNLVSLPNAFFLASKWS